MVDHDTLSRKQTPSRDPASQDLDIAVLMAELQADLAGGPALLSQMKADMEELVQDSNVLIDDHNREQKAKQIVKRFVGRFVRRYKGRKILHKYKISLQRMADALIQKRLAKEKK